MTEERAAQDQADAEARAHASFVSTRTDLARVRAALVASEQGTADSRQVVDVLAAHWREHADVYGVVWKALREEVRRGLLLQLYGWRRQLQTQLAALEAERERTDG